MEVVRSFASVLAVAPVVVLGLFLFFSPVRAFAFGGGGSAPEEVESNGASVVLLVLDELPTASLMDARGGLHARTSSRFRGTGAGLHLVPQRRVPGRLHATGGAGDPHRPPAPR